MGPLSPAGLAPYSAKKAIDMCRNGEIIQAIGTMRKLKVMAIMKLHGKRKMDKETPQHFPQQLFGQHVVVHLVRLAEWS